METPTGEELTPSPGEEEVYEEEAVETTEEEVETSEETAIDAQKVTAMEQELARLREKMRDQDRALDFFQQIAHKQQNQQQEPPQPEYDDGELVEWGTVKKALEQQKQEFALERQKERIEASEMTLRKEVPEWPDIYQTVVKEKYEADPAFRNYIISRPDPARAAYDWAKEQEAFQRLFGKPQSKGTNEDVAKAQRNAQKPKTLSSLGGSSEKKVDWSKMSREEFLKIANQNSYD